MLPINFLLSETTKKKLKSENVGMNWKEEAKGCRECNVNYNYSNKFENFQWKNEKALNLKFFPPTLIRPVSSFFLPVTTVAFLPHFRFPLFRIEEMLVNRWFFWGCSNYMPNPNINYINSVPSDPNSTIAIVDALKYLYILLINYKIKQIKFFFWKKTK